MIQKIIEWEKDEERIGKGSRSGVGKDYDLTKVLRMTAPKPNFLPFKQRFGSAEYVQDAINYDSKRGKIPVVIKIISSATGITEAKRCYDYIARDISEEEYEILVRKAREAGEIEAEAKERLNIPMETEDGQVLANKEERDAILKEWSKDFSGTDAASKQKWKVDKLAAMKTELDALETQAVVGELSEAQNARYQALTKNIRSQKDEKGRDLRPKGVKDTVHMIVSVGGDPTSDKFCEKAAVAIRGWLSKYVGAAGHKYVFVPHRDTDNLHYHVVIKFRSELDKVRGWGVNRDDLFLMRQTLVAELTSFGIERSAVLPRDRVANVWRIINGFDNIEKTHSWFESRLDAGGVRDFNALAYRKNLLMKVSQIRKITKIWEQRATSTEERKALRESNQQLGIFMRKIKTILPKTFEQEKSLTLANITSKHKRVALALERLQPPTANQLASAEAKEQEKRQKYALLYASRIEEEIKRSARYLIDRGQDDGETMGSLQLATRHLQNLASAVKSASARGRKAEHDRQK